MKPITIAHVFPDLLNLYGDGGNVRCLQKRCEWRNISVEVVSMNNGDILDFSDVDLVFLGGGPDREQKLATEQLIAAKEQLRSYVESDGVMLAICGGYQILGSEWLLGTQSVEGLGILDITTKRPLGRSKRLIGNIILSSTLAQKPVVGYENHAGYTYLGEGLQPFGTVLSGVGSGNNDADASDGVLYRNVIGTYLHGPLLGKNPEIADHLLNQVAQVRKARGQETFALSALDDSIEYAANDYLVNRMRAS